MALVDEQSNAVARRVDGDSTELDRLYAHRPSSPSQYLYKACPRCREGTLYSPPNLNDFSCVTCGWVRKCRHCFGDIIMSGTQKVCVGCRRT